MGAKSILCTLCMEKIISLHRNCYIALLFAQRYYSVCRQYRFQSRAKYHSHHCIYFICCTSREKRISENAGGIGGCVTHLCVRNFIEQNNIHFTINSQQQPLTRCVFMEELSMHYE